MKLKKHLLLQLAEQNEIIDILEQIITLERELKVSNDTQTINTQIYKLEERLKWLNR